MNNLFKNVEKLQLNNDENSFVEVVNQFYPKIQKYLSQTQSQQREDLKQELLFILYKKAKTYPLNKVPGFDEFEKKLLNHQ